MKEREGGVGYAKRENESWNMWGVDEVKRVLFLVLVMGGEDPPLRKVGSKNGILRNRKRKRKGCYPTRYSCYCTKIDMGPHSRWRF